MKKTCEVCRHEQICRAIFGQSDSILCGTTTFDFTDIEYSIDDFTDVLEFNKFINELSASDILPEKNKEKVASCKESFTTVLKNLLSSPENMLVEKFNALESLISIFNKDVFNFFNLPDWLMNNENGLKILRLVSLTPHELELADLLYKEYEKQYEKSHR